MFVLEVVVLVLGEVYLLLLYSFNGRTVVSLRY